MRQLSPEEYADLEKEMYLNAVEEQRKVRELCVPYIDAGLDGEAAFIKANLDYDKKYPDQFAYDVELHARVSAERGRQAAVIAEAQENQNKFYSRFDESGSKTHAQEETFLVNQLENKQQKPKRLRNDTKSN